MSQNESMTLYEAIAGLLVLVVGIVVRQLFSRSTNARTDAYEEVVRDLLEDKRRLTYELKAVKKRVKELEHDSG